MAAFKIRGGLMLGRGSLRGRVAKGACFLAESGILFINPGLALFRADSLFGGAYTVYKGRLHGPCE